MRAAGLAAIALTLIIAVPILLGYGLASEDTEYTKTSETGTASLTDTLFNAEADYFIDYAKTSNNSNMLQRVTSQGGNYYIYTSPDYVSTGSTYTSFPAYETTSTESTVSGSDILSTATATLTAEQTIYYIGFYVGATPDWSGIGGIDFGWATATANTTFYSIDSGNEVWVFIDGQVDTSYTVYDPEEAGGISSTGFTSAYLGDGEYVFEVGSTQYTGEWAYICCQAGGTATIKTYDYQTISASSEDWILTTGAAMAQLTYSDGTVSTVAVTEGITHTSTFTAVDGEIVGDTTSVAVSLTGSGGVLTEYTQTYTEYADTNYGWYNAESDYTTYYNAWYNQYENATVTLYVHFEGNGYTEFYEDFTETSPILTLKRVDESVLIFDSDYTSYDLGTYEYIRVVFDALEDSVTVNGVSAFPPMGGTADLLNTVEVNYDFDGYIEFLKIVDQFDTVSEQTAEYYAENGESTTVTLDRAINLYNYYYLKNEATGEYITDGWSATWVEEGSADVVFTPTSLADGYYTLGHYSPPPSSGSVLIYVGDVNSVSTSPIAYRVDRATVVAGQYPSTTDYTLDLWGLFPSDTVQKLYINSIGVYGNSIGIGSRNYTVTDGKITITDMEDGEEYEIKVLKSTISMTYEDGSYSVSVNGHVITSSTTTAPTIYFGGEWSMTATRSTVTEETAVKTEWVPGEFALDKDGFVLAMVLTAAAAFVVLGMTGARSGAKVGLLALICGGACAVGLIIL